MELAITTHDLEVRYGNVVALAGVNLIVPAGKSLAVVGANGSGKSTLLGALARLHRPTSGTAWVGCATPALVLQATEVQSDLPITALDTVKLARYPTVGLLRRFRGEDKDAVRSAVQRMKVEELSNTALQNLSGGQRQRVLMAQGLAQESPVLLLDEPMTGLDITSRQLVLDVIDEETAYGNTVVMTTHSLADARHCDLVLLLDTVQVAFGAPGDVLVEENLRRAFTDRVVQVGTELIVDDHHVH